MNNGWQAESFIKNIGGKISNHAAQYSAANNISRVVYPNIYLPIANTCRPKK